MPRKDPSEKLPVPGPWQPAVQAAMQDLAERLSLPTSRLAVTRVRALAEASSPAGSELEIWLLAAGRGYRYRATAASGATLLETSGA